MLDGVEIRKTYDREQIQVSTKTVCAKGRKFRICSKQASRQALHLSKMSSGIGDISVVSTIDKYGR